MHLYLAVRGILDSINRWENDIAADYRPMPITEKTAKIIDPNAIPYPDGKYYGTLQTSIRPIRFYEVVVPKIMMPGILRKIQPTNCWNPKYQPYIWAIRKALRLDKVDLKKIPARTNADAMCWRGVDATVIGTKKDAIIDKQEQI